MSRKHDIIVIGGGPAGIMAAGRAAELGAGALGAFGGYKLYKGLKKKKDAEG